MYKYCSFYVNKGMFFKQLIQIVGYILMIDLYILQGILHFHMHLYNLLFVVMINLH